ncbi:MAG: PIN domain-containing protein [Bryobacter sp.]|nr:PIN domain-containing protein [Bryobacter sp.]
MVFVDTSALFAYLSPDDGKHEPARRVLQTLAGGKRPMLTTNYVVLETTALVQRRLGFAALEALHLDVLPLIATDWVLPDLHEESVALHFASRRRQLSLVDCSSFVYMRRHRISEAVAFDRHFSQEGFRLLT